MRYHLPAHISFGIVSGRTVVLDLRADRYFLLGLAEADALTASCAHAGRRDAVPFLDRLASHGLVGRGPGRAIEAVAAPRLRASALETDGDGSGIPAWEAGTARYAAALSLRIAGLASTIMRWRRIRTRLKLRSGEAGEDPGGACSSQAADLARAYRAARLFVPARRLCIPDSLALARTLWRRGVDADIFFGVQLAPFTAHCWVQRGGLLLSDPIDRVAEFSPVFRL